MIKIQSGSSSRSLPDLPCLNLARFDKHLVKDPLRIIVFLDPDWIFLQYTFRIHTVFVNPNSNDIYSYVPSKILSSSVGRILTN
jgi:hypothetical protein